MLLIHILLFEAIKKIRFNLKDVIGVSSVGILITDGVRQLLKWLPVMPAIWAFMLASVGWA